jgi:hypothetical protein
MLAQEYKLSICYFLGKMDQKYPWTGVSVAFPTALPAAESAALSTAADERRYSPRRIKFSTGRSS